MDMRMVGIDGVEATRPHPPNWPAKKERALFRSAQSS
jgi:hypothetical protein